MGEEESTKPSGENYYSWVEKDVVQTKTEPSVDQILHGNDWIIARWMSDLCRDPNYVPTKETLDAMFFSTVSSWYTTEDINSSPEYQAYMEEVLNAGPEKWEEVEDQLNQMTYEEINDLIGRTPKKLEATDFGIRSSSSSSSQESIEDQYRQVILKKEKKGTFNEGFIVDRSDHNPAFETLTNTEDDELGAKWRVVKELGKRVSGSKEGGELASNIMDSFGKLYKGTDFEQSTQLFYFLTEIAGKPNENNREFYDKFATFISSKKTEKVSDNEEGYPPYDVMYDYTTADGERLRMNITEVTDMHWTIFGYGDNRTDALDGLVMAGARLKSKDEEAYYSVFATIFGEKGPAGVLNYMREVISDSSYSKGDRELAAEVFKTFYKNVANTSGESVIPSDITNFYSLVVNNEAYMTEETEGEKRVTLIDKILREEGVTTELAVDTACGKGWLTKRLKEKGFNVIGVDLNEDLIKIAKERFPEEQYYTASWDKMEDVPGIEDAKIFMINGRSIHHLSQFGGLHAMMTQMEDAEMIIFDGLDPKTGGLSEKLDTFRLSLENFKFSKEWLANYMWQGVGSHDGVTLGDRWYPPEEWWRNMFGMYGFEMKIIREENYNGGGVDNLVYVAKKIKDEEERKAQELKSSEFFKALMDAQPVNENGYQITDHPRPWRKSKHSN